MSTLCLGRCGQRLMDHISMIFIKQDLYLFFFVQCENTVVTQERINMSFCTEHSVIGHLGAYREGKQKKKRDFCLQWFQFYREVLGWLAQGERFLDNEGWLIILTKKNASRQGGVWERFYLSVLVKIYDCALFLSSLLSHLPWCHPSPHFPLPFHHTISRSSSSMPKKYSLACDS